MIPGLRQPEIAEEAPPAARKASAGRAPLTFCGSARGDRPDGTENAECPRAANPKISSFSDKKVRLLDFPFCRICGILLLSGISHAACSSLRFAVYPEAEKLRRGRRVRHRRTKGVDRVYADGAAS